MVDLTAKPFNLNAEQIEWVENTINSMTLDEKIGQLFVLMRTSPDPEFIKNILNTYHQGGLRWQGGNKEAVYAQNQNYQNNSKIPLLIAANCDNGGDGCLPEGTFICSAAGAGASKGTDVAYYTGLVAGREAAAIGANWMFNPVSDIFMNWRNTIVNTRSFGNDKKVVIDNAKAYMRGLHESNMAACCKHFPGDGVEERDQHLVLGCNDLPYDTWNETFGDVYRAMIDEGVESFMIGHIAAPAVSRHFKPELKDSEIMPATLSKELLDDLLRKELGFNGVIITDASHMGGIANMERREIAIPKAIASGCDMFLFASETEEDFNYMKAGYEKGVITEERLSDALHRILGLKAKLNLHKNRLPDPSVKDTVVGCAEHQKYADFAADESITLVKDTQHNLPINPEKQKRARLVFIQSTPSSKSYKGDPVKQVVIEELEKAGFTVDVAPNFHDIEVAEGPSPTLFLRMMSCGSMEEFRKKYDVVFFVIHIKGYALENNVRLRFSCSHSNEMPWFVTEVPTVGISLNYTTHLFDVPQIHTFINAYGDTRGYIAKTIEKITGKSEFKGTANDTVFCDRWETRL
ncbi:MAG: glycosyl hydrolase [Treponemataceae bacterium]|nr:glycosyl hydrolase [Treponemataceae bacterium]